MRLRANDADDGSPLAGVSNSWATWSVDGRRLAFTSKRDDPAYDVFITTIDGNGNSGSATLNAKGELVGLAFDGTLDSVASDWLYLKSVTRTIHVDLRYMLWVVEILGGDAADPLLRELGVEPRL